MKHQFAIVHFNTPELTEATVWSLRKHGMDWPVYIFDNSDQLPFTSKMQGVEVIDNTKGQIIDFDRELEKFSKAPYGKVNNYGSVRHMMSIQKLFDILPDGFILLDSDVLIRKHLGFMFQEGQVAVGHLQSPQPGNNFGIPRLVPMVCYINVPECRKRGISYFDPNRSWMIHSSDVHDRLNWYDTGASFFEDIHAHKNGAHGRRIDIRPLMEHYKKGSWLRKGTDNHRKWLQQYWDLWKPTPRMKGITNVAICAIGRNENPYAVEWVEHYRKIGVSKIFVYDNFFDGETPLADTLKDYVDSGFVEITSVPNRKSLQCKAYEDCYKKHGNDYAWIGFLDFDEYLRWTTREKIEKKFSKYNDADCVLVNWRLMTDNGLVHYDPRPLKERFKEVMPVDKPVKYDRPENDHVKCFVRGGLNSIHFGTNPHCPSDSLRYVNSEGKPVKGGAFTPYTHKVMRIDHYWTKTAEEWIRNKLSRGFASGHTYIENFLRAQERYFFAVNERAPEKEAIIRSGVDDSVVKNNPLK